MALLGDLTNRFKHLLSPSESRQRRDKEFKAKVAPLPRQVSHETPARNKTVNMSPGAAITTWDVNPSPRPNINLNAKVDGAQLPPSPPTSFGQADTETIAAGESSSVAPAFNLKPAREDWDANEETILVDDGYYDEQQKDAQKVAELERERRDAQAMELRAAGWSEDAVFLFQKLGLRGFEPLLPYGWFDDFKMLPADLFTHNMDKAFIKPIGDDYRAQRALERLFALGGRVRDAVLQRAIRTPEMRIHKAIRNYNTWALTDARVEILGYQLPLFEIVACRKNVSPKKAEARMIRRLDRLAEQWRAAFRERRLQDAELDSGNTTHNFNEGPDIPTLYGVVACHTVMAFVSYDVNAATPLLRTVAMFDLGQEGYDVWNSLAIAIFVIHCRNRLIQLKEFVPHPAKPSVEDPDV